MTEHEAEVPGPSHVARVSLKLPLFWPAYPQVWFAQVEAQFATRGITAQKTMFNYIIAFLSPDVATKIQDLILQPPSEESYNRLKERLIKRMGVSKQRRLQQL